MSVNIDVQCALYMYRYCTCIYLPIGRWHQWSASHRCLKHRYLYGIWWWSWWPVMIMISFFFSPAILGLSYLCLNLFIHGDVFWCWFLLFDAVWFWLRLLDADADCFGLLAKQRWHLRFFFVAELALWDMYEVNLPQYVAVAMQFLSRIDYYFQIILF